MGQSRHQPCRYSTIRVRALSSLAGPLLQPLRLRGFRAQTWACKSTMPLPPLRPYPLVSTSHLPQSMFPLGNIACHWEPSSHRMMSSYAATVSTLRPSSALVEVEFAFCLTLELRAALTVSREWACKIWPSSRLVGLLAPGRRELAFRLVILHM